MNVPAFAIGPPSNVKRIAVTIMRCLLMKDMSTMVVPTESTDSILTFVQENWQLLRPSSRIEGALSLHVQDSGTDITYRTTSRFAIRGRKDCHRGCKWRKQKYIHGVNMQHIVCTFQSPNLLCSSHGRSQAITRVVEGKSWGHVTCEARRRIRTLHINVQITTKRMIQKHIL